MVQRWHHCGNVVFQTGGLVYDRVLLMKCEDRLWRLVVFLSKSLNETERNYKIHDKKMLAIIRGLDICWKMHISSSRSGQITRTWNTL